MPNFMSTWCPCVSYNNLCFHSARLKVKGRVLHWYGFLWLVWKLYLNQNNLTVQTASGAVGLWLAVDSENVHYYDYHSLLRCSTCAPPEPSKGITSYLSCLEEPFFPHLIVFASSMDQMIAGVIRKSNCTGPFLERHDIIPTESKLSFLWPPAPRHPPPSDLWPVNGWHISRGSLLMAFDILPCVKSNQAERGGKCTKSTGSSAESDTSK